MTNPPPISTTATPFPTRSKTASKLIANIPTTATSLFFADKILITISQRGKLAHWLHVPLTSSTPTSSLASLATDPYDPSAYPPSDLLPLPHLTATTVLGGTVAGLDTVGQVLATQLASAVVQRDGEEKRTMIVGLGLERRGNGVGREEWEELVGLGLDVI
ncbi:hypothetical protein M501DRAFT_1006913 [Patellaria atrata CBS 101060]|uniref:Proteasome assembly chaperone 3 n=1 Tax=Patellaria atrata CBS 101060 TaxID=1346257 RepID=A0A9P4S6R7_9PEZI|nr:hypothetical protein M501DRAFT_1006913 [Patellaria atrata CBS 101060]